MAFSSCVELHLVQRGCDNFFKALCRDADEVGHASPIVTIDVSCMIMANTGNYYLESCIDFTVGFSGKNQQKIII